MSDRARPPASLAIEVVCAWPDRAWRVALALEPGSTVRDALRASEVETALPGVVVDAQHVGIFSRPAMLSTELRDGDRVEIYRPLLCDPKQERRERAARAKSAKR